MNDRTVCTRRTLSVGDFAHVEQCGCGAVHVTIGAVTLRLAANALGPLADTISDAAHAMQHDHIGRARLAPEVLS